MHYKGFSGLIWLVRARLDNIYAPRCRQFVTAKLESEKNQSLRDLVCIEPVQITIERIFPARAISWVGHNAQRSGELTSYQDREVDRSAESTYLILANFSNEPLIISKATILGVAEMA